MDVGIRELKLRLSAYVARVRAGETVVVTDRGKPVARIERIEPEGPPSAVRHLVEAGILLYKSPKGPPPKPIRLLPGEKTSTDYLREQRR